ncbi:glycosyltransferase family 25 protein [Aeromonas caviae]|uniref:glycosyltransferase family 25 protein n=1 Tax=Aeromonas caviae TaxID=648 RepID=UPI0029D79467|nr:glycosyltransferase family 25 protein [Aeromonas caviae]MDX7678480.1 glycosyltransferase family 25 protein [Aeromonas caviae]MDX7811691.1 glycosyltransferase family 25 protein [Aeromonas caviae]
MSFNGYVISLVDEYQRRKSISEQLVEKKAFFSFIDAVDLRNSKIEDLSSLINDVKSGSLNRPLTKGEIGCALSHFKCYQKLLASNDDWAWILEDDANLERLQPDSIDKIISLVSGSDIDIVILGYSKLSKCNESKFYKFEPLKKVIQVDGLLLGRPWRNWTCGTVSYLISRAGAKKILDYFNDDRVITVADDWSFFEEKIGVNILHCRPLLVFEDFIRFQSSLEADRAVVSKRKIDFLDVARVLRGYLRRLLMGLEL